MTTFVCTGDSHIGKGSHLYPERLAEQEAAWRRTLELARTENAEAVLHAGDLFDRRRPSPAELVAVVRPLMEHVDAGGCRVDIIPGNHDPVAYGPGGLDVLDEACVATVHRAPAVVRLGDVDVCVLPWTPSSRLVAERGGRAGVADDAAELLLGIARDLHAEASPVRATMLLGHWSAAGAKLPTGLPVEALTSEPVLDTGALLDLGFDALVFGHIHVAGPLDLPFEPDALAMYVGSPITLDHGEARVEHGAWVVELGYGDPYRVSLEDVGGRTFVTLNLEDVLDRPKVVAGAVVRVKDTLPHDHDVDLEAVRRDLIKRGAVRVDLAVTVERAARRPLINAVDSDRQPIHLLADYLGSIEVDDEHAERLLEQAHTYLAGERTPAEKGGVT